MTRSLRLILFDVDGTLVDSQASILSAMNAAFGACGLEPPERAATLSIVGLSLPHALARLAPDFPDCAALVAAYKSAYFAQRTAGAPIHASPLYPGAAQALALLSATPENLLGIATGKSRRGLDALLAEHRLGDRFVTRQTADDHPSKPHPSMIEAAMAETGTEPCDTVMIGDTSFDMDMARAAGVAAIGVSWGYHTADALRHADAVIAGFDDLMPALDMIWERQG